jgi:hypothetical protein
MGPNYEGMSGLANGIKEGLLGYQTQQQIKRQQGMEDLLKGVQKNPDTGAYEYTPLKQNEINMQQKKLQTESESYDPNSAYSKQIAGAYGGLLGENRGANLQGLSAEQMKGMAPALTGAIKTKEAIPVDEEMQNLKKGLIQSQIKNYNTPQVENPNLGVRQDAITARAISKITSDPVINAMKTQGRQMDKAVDLLNQDHVANKTLAEVGQDIAGALSGKNAASDFKMKQVEVNNLQKELADKLSFWTSNPEQPAPPDIVNFWKNMANRLNTGIDKQVEGRANEFSSGLEDTYKHTPQAIDAVKTMVKSHKAGQWRHLGDESNQAQGLVQQQAKPAIKPQTINQGGHIYNLNPQSGEYE